MKLIFNIYLKRKYNKKIRKLMGIKNIEKALETHYTIIKKQNKNRKEMDNLLFSKSNAMIPLDFLEDYDELSVNVEEIASNIILVSEISSA